MVRSFGQCASHRITPFVVLFLLFFFFPPSSCLPLPLSRKTHLQSTHICPVEKSHVLRPSPSPFSRCLPLRGAALRSSQGRPPSRPQGLRAGCGLRDLRTTPVRESNRPVSPRPLGPVSPSARPAKKRLITARIRTPAAAAVAGGVPGLGLCPVFSLSMAPIASPIVHSFTLNTMGLYRWTRRKASAAVRSGLCSVRRCAQKVWHHGDRGAAFLPLQRTKEAPLKIERHDKLFYRGGMARPCSASR